MSIYDNGCMNCSVCGKFCIPDKAGSVETEISDLDGKICLVGVVCKNCTENGKNIINKG